MNGSRYALDPQAKAMRNIEVYEAISLPSVGDADRGAESKFCRWRHLDTRVFVARVV